MMTTTNDWDQTVHVELEEEIVSALEQRAEALGLLPGEFSGIILTAWLSSKETLNVIEP